MSDPIERLGTDEFSVTAENTASQLAEYYGRSDLFEGLKLEFVDERGVDEDRQYSAVHHNGTYTVCLEDVDWLESEIGMTGFDGDAHSLAVGLYIGLALTGTLVHSELERTRASTRTYERAEILKELLCSHADVEGAVRAAFLERYGHKFTERSHMTEALGDKDAMIINGMRMRLLFLFSALSVDGLNLLDIKKIAKEYLATAYDRDAGFFEDMSFKALGQNPIVGDKMFFNTMPDWVLAGLSPMSTGSIDHLFSQAWRQDI